MSDDRPREWWIYTMKPLDVFSDTGKCLGVKVACGALCVDPETIGINDGQHIRVVDAEIYEDIQAKLERAREALKFYCQLGHDLYAPGSMTETIVKTDGGDKAREALKELE